MNRIHFSTLLSLLFFLSCCKEDSPLPNPTSSTPIYIPQEIKEYIFFKIGTYWIYEEKNSGIIDSVYVISAANQIDSSYLGNKDPEFNRLYEWIKVKTKSSYDGFEYEYYLHTSFVPSTCLSDPNKSCFSIKTIKSKPGKYVGETWALLYKFIKGNWAYAGYSPTSGYYSIVTLTNIYDSINVNNIYYKNVIEVHDTKNITIDDNQTKLFWTRKFGLIKKELIDSTQIWSMIRCKIYQ